MNGWEAVAVLTISLYNLALVAGCAWIIYHGGSAWWILVALIFGKSLRTGKAAEN